MSSSVSPSVLTSNIGLSRCPESSTVNLDFPSTTILCSVFSLLAFVVAFVVVAKYNFMLWWLGENSSIGAAVRWGISSLFKKNRDDGGSLHTASISNSYWVLYFLGCGVRGVIESVLFGFPSIHNKPHAVAIMQFSSWAVDSIYVTFLTLALLYQFHYRSGENVANPQPVQDDSSGATRRHTWVSALFTAEVGLALLAMVHIIAAWWATPDIPDGSAYSNSFWVLMGVIGLQRIPLLMLMIVVSFPKATDASPSSSPSLLSRATLLTGCICDLPASIPFHTWSKYILPSAIKWSPCPLNIFSWLDIIVLLHAFALCCFILFLKLEFKRVHEMEYYECLQNCNRVDNRTGEWD